MNKQDILRVKAHVTEGRYADGDLEIVIPRREGVIVGEDTKVFFGGEELVGATKVTINIEPKKIVTVKLEKMTVGDEPDHPEFLRERIKDDPIDPTVDD